MTKKSMALCLAFTIMISVFTGFSALAAEKKDMMTNGSFEDVAANGIPAGWALTGAKADESFFVSTDSPSEGAKSIRFYGDISAFVATTINNIKPGNEYEFTGMLKKIDTKGDGPMVKVTYQAPDGKGSYTTLEEPSSAFTGTRKGKWEKVTFKSTAPEDAARAIILVRLVGGGECYWDDCHFIGEPSDGAVAAANTSKVTTEKASSTVDAGPVAAPSASTITSISEVGDGKYNLIKNGDFEIVSTNNLPADWGLSGGKVMENMVVSTSDPQSGKNSVRFYGDTSSIFISSIVTGFIEGEEYEFSGYIKYISGEGTPTITLSYQTPSGTTFASVGDQYGSFNTKANTWEKVTYKSKVPATATRLIILVRLVGGGECYWDNVAFVGKAKESTALVAKYSSIIGAQKVESGESDNEHEYKPPFRDSKNILLNSDFEAVAADGKSIDNWTSIKGWSNDSGWGYVEKEDVHGGSTAVKIVDKGSQNPYISQIVDVVGGAEYQLSYWVKVLDGPGTPTTKLEFWGDRSLAGAAAMGQKYASLDGHSVIPKGEWIQKLYTFTPSENVRSMTVLVRLLSSAGVESSAIFDDVQIYMTNAPDAFKLDTDWVFYYSDWDKGTISGNANLQFYPELLDCSYDFKVMDGNTVIFEKNGVKATNGYAEAKFDLSILKEKKKEYTAVGILYDNAGNELLSHKQAIFKYDRPNYLRSDGVYLKNGKEEFYPVYAYHVSTDHYDEVAKAGINVVQSNMASVEGLGTYLDAAEKEGIMILLVLYNGMKPAGNIANIEHTVESVLAYRDHPALFAYAIMDEPFLGLTDPEQDLWNSYRIIRDLDDNHPIYTVEADSGYYRKAAKCVDILGIDPYGAAAGKNAGSSTELAMKAVDYKKPVYTLLQAFRNMNGHMPTGDEERNTIYQALICGASAIGYYSISDCEIDANGKYSIPIFEVKDLWDSIMLYANSELTETYKHFVLSETPYFNEARENDYWYSSWVNGNDIYMAVLGMKQSGQGTASIPLTSFDGSIKVGNYTATVVAGKDAATFTGNGTLNVTFDAVETVLYKITPSESIDFSRLGVSSFDDIEDYPWARTQINFLDSKNIANKYSDWAYKPADKITRAEFAYFLVRTLGLTSDSAENFADVDPKAFYAKEIAVGKALGILNGVGDNKYNPEAEISRQDLMTIVARGLGLTGETDLSAFTDSGLISDYAQSSVKAMIAKGFIKGNADGTINPIGNTTRAEAAVIMYRIYNR